jgi:nucleoside-diphosphate-sugar epimerase
MHIEPTDHPSLRPDPTTPRTYVVTGAAGFIGGRLAERLLADGHSVIGIDAYTDTYDVAEKRDRTTALRREPRYTHVEGDLIDLALEPILEPAEVVFHLAGRPGVRPSFELRDLYWHDNVEATARLLSAARRAASVRRLVYASSSSVYGDAPLPLRETGMPAPISPYGQSKLEAEQLCLAADGDGLETVALRYFTVYGPGQRPDMGMRRFAEAALAGRSLTLLGDGTQSRDFTYVDDIVDATRRAADAPVAGMAVNVGGGSRVTLLEVFAILEDLVGRPLEVDAQPFARGDVRHTVADLSRARDLLGFRASVRFREGYRREVEWLRGLAETGATATTAAAA